MTSRLPGRATGIHSSTVGPDNNKLNLSMVRSYCTNGNHFRLKISCVTGKEGHDITPD